MSQPPDFTTYEEEYKERWKVVNHHFFLKKKLMPYEQRQRSEGEL